MTVDPLSLMEILAVARAAGLGEAVELFPDDVIAAASAAAKARTAFAATDEATAEPWPPMFIRPIP